MPKFYDYLKSIYTKEKIDTSEITMSLVIALTKWMSADTGSLYYLKHAVPFLFYLEPVHYYYLLCAIIPRRRYAPYFKKIDKKENKKEIQVLLEIQKYFGWSDKELELSKKYLIKNKKYWKKEFGLK